MKKMICFVLLTLFAAAGTLSAFETSTRIYPADAAVTLRFKAVSPWAKEWLQKTEAFIQSGAHKKLRKGKDFPLVGYYREDRRYSNSEEFRASTIPEPAEFKIEGQEILVNAKFKGANFHFIVFSKLPAEVGKKGFRNFRYVKFMTLDAETFKLRPFKGNLHQHSNVSDGKFEPKEHAAYARIAGFDFIGLSDHGTYAQNASLIQAAADSKSGLTVYPAEELHTPGNILHGLSIGATKAHSFRGPRSPEWMKEVQPIVAEIHKKNPSLLKSEILPWAESLILAKRAREDGALVVYCHPAWHPRYYINNPRAMADHMMRSGAFDAIEVINGSMFNKSGRENMETLAQFHEICVELGKKIPVMSSSDSHNVAGTAYRRNYNVIFAPDCTFASCKAAFVEGRAVASYDLDEKKSSPMNLGAFRFVCYANFLDEIGFWQKQSEYGKIQGGLIMKYLKGDQSVLAEIEKLAKKIEENRESFYYHPEK